MRDLSRPPFCAKKVDKMSKRMKAPEGTNSAVIEGHDYSKELQKSKDGIITVAQDNHVDMLKRMGFTEWNDQENPDELERQIADMDDKDELVEFIEERGGDADNSMSIKKLRRLARKAAGVEDED